MKCTAQAWGRKGANSSFLCLMFYLGPEWVKPVSPGEGHLLYWAHQFKCWPHPETPSQTHPEIMYHLGSPSRVKLIHKINHQTHHNLSWKKRRKQKRGRMSNNCEKNVKHTLLECDTINTRRKRPSGSQEEEIVREVTIRAHRRVPSRCPLHWLIYIGTNN